MLTGSVVLSESWLLRPLLHSFIKCTWSPTQCVQPLWLAAGLFVITSLHVADSWHNLFTPRRQMIHSCQQPAAAQNASVTAPPQTHLSLPHRAFVQCCILLVTSTTTTCSSCIQSHNNCPASEVNPCTTPHGAAYSSRLTAAPLQG